MGPLLEKASLTGRHSVFEGLFLTRPLLGSGGLFRRPVVLWRTSGSRRGCGCLRWLRGQCLCRSFDDRRLRLWNFHVREAQLHDSVAEFHVATPVLKPHDLRRQDEWLDAPLQLIAPRMAIARRLPARAAFAYLFDFYFSDGFADPLRALWLTCPQKDLGSRLREHHLGVQPVMLLQLAASLKAQNYRVVRLAVPGDGIVQLGQFLQKRNLVQNEPTHGVVSSLR